MFIEHQYKLSNLGGFVNMDILNEPKNAKNEQKKPERFVARALVVLISRLFAFT